MRYLLVALVLAVLSGCAAGAPPSEKKKTPDFSASGFAACPPSTGRAPEGSPLDVALPCMTGKGVRTVVGAPVGVPRVVNLWGSWCAPCGAEMPVFEAFHRAAGERVAVLGVNTEDGANRALAAAGEVRVTFPNVYDRDGTVRRALGRNALPVTVFVRADGTVATVHTGPLDAAGLRAAVTRYLGVTV